MSTIAPEVADLGSVVQEVWGSFVGHSEPLIPRGATPGSAPVQALWSGAVSVSGGWEGRVTVELAEHVARASARIMLGLEDTEPVTDDDVADAVGELANMVGGNVKSLMPGPSALSLPAVAAGRAVFPSDAREVARLDLLWADQPVRVSVHCPERP